MENIIGRSVEIKKLQQLYEQENPVFLAVYGRRRVGKTYLVTEYLQSKGIFFELTGSKKASKKDQLKNFHREFSILFSDFQSLPTPKDWGEAFNQLNKAINQIEENQKIILFFDELPWLASPKSGFLPAFEYIWNKHFSRRKNLMLIICGSAASWMIKKIVQNKSGFYGRLTGILPLYPFKLNETENLLHSKNITFDRKQLVELFMITGGIAAYLDHIRANQSLVQNINELCFTTSGPLFLEFNNLFQSLFDHSEKHINIVKLLAKKRRGLTQSTLLKHVGLPQSGRSTEVLTELESCGFIAPLPFFGKVTKEKRFRLIDEYSYFYLSWIAPEYHAILRGSDHEYWQKTFNSGAWLSWTGYAFENICLKHISNIKKNLGIASVKTTESYWQYTPKRNSDEDGAEIDLIIDRADNCIHLCEIKFSNRPFNIDKQYAKKLIQKREIFRQKTGTRKSLFITLITPFGVVDNQYYRDIVQSQITLDALF